MSYSFIINPLSGTRKNKKFLEKIINQDFPDKKEIHHTNYPGHASVLAAQAVKMGFKNVIAIGGDGTLNEVASSLVSKNVNLGLVPMGSGNGFARSLNIPLVPQEAFNILRTGIVKSVDVGMANNDYFFAVAGIGFEAYVAAAFQKSKLRGPVIYFYKGLKTYLTYPYPTFFLENDSTKLEIKPFTLAVANGTQYGNGAIICPQADMYDGLLDICTIDKMNIVALLKHVKMMFANKIDQLPGYQTFKSSEITIKSKGKIYYHTDGEPKTADESIIINILPQKLKVLKPKE